MGLLFIGLAAIFAAMNNLLLRLSLDAGGTSKGYLAVQVMFSSFVMILLNPVCQHDFTWNSPVVLLGALGGLILGFFFWGLGKTMELGPPGLSIAILNASSLIPALLMFILFGAAFGHEFTLIHALAFVLVVAGIFWAGSTSEANPHRKLWIICALFMFALHSLFLAFLQWWAMILNPNLPATPLLPIRIYSPHVQWFMPAIFFVAGLFQWGMLAKNEHRLPSAQETKYGLLGGVLNGLCAFFLILAPQMAAPWENALLFPVYTVGILLVCNLWARKLYTEKVNWKATALCVLGLLIGGMA